MGRTSSPRSRRICPNCSRVRPRISSLSGVELDAACCKHGGSQATLLQHCARPCNAGTACMAGDTGFLEGFLLQLLLGSSCRPWDSWPGCFLFWPVKIQGSCAAKPDHAMHSSYRGMQTAQNSLCAAKGSNGPRGQPLLDAALRMLALVSTSELAEFPLRHHARLLFRWNVTNR